MTEEEQQQESSIPEFASREEEAEFWDTHDVTDYWDELKPVHVRFAQNLSEGIAVRLDQATLQKLRSLAKDKGMDPSVMARMWIMERLEEGKTQPW